MKNLFAKQSMLLGGALLCAIATAHAAPVNLSVDADTSVRGGSLGTRSFGNYDILRVRNTVNLDHARKAFVRFNLAGLPASVKTATGAALNLTIGNAEGESPADKVWTFQVFGLKDNTSGENWSEQTTSWENAPSNKADSGSALGDDAVPLGTFTVTGKGEAGKTVSVSSPELLKFLQNDTTGKATFIITRNEAGNSGADNVVHIFASKENKSLTPPVLSVAFDGSNPLAPVAAVAALPTGQPLRVFLIGNSFSQNASRFLPDLARNGNRQLVIGRAESPGYSLAQHWQAVEANEANATDKLSGIYGGKSLKALLSEGTWDIVSIQQSSVYSSDVNIYQPFAQKLRDYIKTIQPNAEVVFHQTWAYRNDAKSFGYSNAAIGQRTQSAQEMWEKSRAAARTVAGDLKMRVIPVGDAFWKVSSDPKFGYKKDTAFNYDNPVAPNLPNQMYSLNDGYAWHQNNTKLNFDPNHANEAGQYLGGLVWYGFLFKESPEKLTFVPSGITADFAAFLRKSAAETLKESK